MAQFDGRYKWVFDGVELAAAHVPIEQEPGVTHGEMIEEHFGRPGAPATEFEQGIFELSAACVIYQIYYSSGSDSDVERAIEDWVARNTGVRVLRILPDQRDWFDLFDENPPPAGDT